MMVLGGGESCERCRENMEADRRRRERSTMMAMVALSLAEMG
jgi:predicted nucleic acid-binding Zn ribbon protein